jgi:hypothetical protein
LDGGIKEQRLHEATGGGDDAASGGREENRGPDLGSAGGVESKILGLRSRSGPPKRENRGLFYMLPVEMLLRTKHSRY